MVCAAMGVMLVMIAAGSATAQIGKSVSVAAGTPEDKALTDIYAATDGPDKIALLDKFMADFGKGDMELLGDQLYVQIVSGAEELREGVRVRRQGAGARSG